MRILYLSQYFPPEAGATQARAYEMARYLVQKGHAVTLIAEIPNHPSGIIPPFYRGKVFERLPMDGIDIIRVWVRTTKRKNFYNRLMFYLSYSINASLAGMLLRKKYDLVYASSPPLFVGIPGLILSIFNRLPLFFEVRDLWPESAIALGELKQPIAIRWAEYLESTCYQRALRIVAVTTGIQKRILERGIPEEKAVVVENGANTEDFRFRPELRAQLRELMGLENKFVLMYAGIIGLAQGLEILIASAQILADQEDIIFIILGEGPKRTEIERLVNENGLSNVRLLPEVPRQAIPGYLSAADAAVVPLLKQEVFQRVVPTKMFDAWACERPILLGVDGEARKLLQSCTGGIYYTPEDPQALAKAALQLKDDDISRTAMGKSGRMMVEAYFSRKSMADKLEQILITALSEANSKSK